MRGIRPPVSTVAIPAVPRILSISTGYLASRSRMRNLICARCPVSSRSMSRLRMAWVTPCVGGVCGGADYPYTPAGVVDGSENVLALTGQRDRFDEVHRQDRRSLRAQKVGPRNGCPARGRIDVCSLEDLPHRRRGDRDTQEREFTVDASIPPRGVLGCQAQDEVADRSDSARTPRPSVHDHTGMAALHQVPMPPQHRIRADQESESAQRRAAQGHEQGGEQRPVLRRQSWTLITELSFQDSELMA